MRVVAGKHRGRPLKEFKGREIRPTSDRAKEALFNILQFDIQGCDFLDLFSGTGGIGIEAISRGANKVVFVDNAKESVKLLKQNLDYLKENADVHETDAVSYVSLTKEKFDFIFLDPPYKFDCKELIIKIAKRGLLKEGGLIVYEHSDKSLGKIDGVNLVDTRSYGIATFDFYETEKRSEGDNE